MTHRSLSRLLACLLISLAALLMLLNAPLRAAARPLPQEDLPTEGWTVCSIGGMQFISEVGETRQVFEVCQGQGWRYQAYCTQPNVPVPILGAFCSLFSGGSLWCGEGVQQLQLYAILQTPEATATPTSTATATASSTPTATITPTGTPQPFTITPTETVTDSLTATPPILRTFPPGGGRPRPGGPGNVEAAGILVAGIILAAAGGLAAAAFTVRKRGGRSGRA